MVQHDRLRFAEFVLDRLSNGRCRARVGLTWRESEQFAGQCEGLASQAGELRCAAQACVNALGQAVAGGMGFDSAAAGQLSTHSGSPHWRQMASSKPSPEGTIWMRDCRWSSVCVLACAQALMQSLQPSQASALK